MQVHSNTIKLATNTLKVYITSSKTGQIDQHHNCMLQKLPLLKPSNTGKRGFSAGLFCPKVLFRNGKFSGWCGEAGSGGVFSSTIACKRIAMIALRKQSTFVAS
jgi:hypothetical protein